VPAFFAANLCPRTSVFIISWCIWFSEKGELF
jgi:hypothetical protein